MKTLLTLGKSNTKTAKTADRVEQAILHLAPATLGGRKNVCTFSSTQCVHACLNLSGLGIMDSVQSARIARTQLLFDDREAFLEILCKDIDRLRKRAAKKSLLPVVRLNGTSDLLWERMPVTVDGVTYASVMDRYTDVQFYDYTKIPTKHRRNLPSNYHITFSLSENNESSALEALLAGVNVAVVFDSESLPATYFGRPVINGSSSDLRYEDPSGVVVGLCAKGKARKVAGTPDGFVRSASLPF